MPAPMELAGVGAGARLSYAFVCLPPELPSSVYPLVGSLIDTHQQSRFHRCWLTAMLRLEGAERVSGWAGALFAELVAEVTDDQLPLQHLLLLVILSGQHTPAGERWAGKP